MQYLSQPCRAVSHDSHTVPKLDHSWEISIREGQISPAVSRSPSLSVAFVLRGVSDIDAGCED